MPSRFLPFSVLGFQEAMDTAKRKSESSSSEAITPATLARLNVLQPEYYTKVENRGIAASAQLNATKADDEALAICRMHISQYFQVFNFGITRGLYPVSARAFYGIDANQTRLPDLIKDNDVLHWALAIHDGEEVRVADGGIPMVNPSADEIYNKYLICKDARDLKSEMKDAYDDAQEAVSAMRKTVKRLVVDMWDEIDFFYRNELTASSKRRKCREWGVFYTSRRKAIVSGVVTDADTGEAIPDVTVRIDDEEAAYTNESGEYSVSKPFSGEAIIAFTHTGYGEVSFKIELQERTAIIQNAKLKAI